MEDYKLENKYLLKKDSLLIITMPVQHSALSIWAVTPSTRVFYFRSQTRIAKPCRSGWLCGALMLCLGRHGANTKIIAFATLTVLRFDVMLTGRNWPCPSTDKAMWTATPPPNEDFEVELRARMEDGANQERRVMFSGSNKAMEMWSKICRLDLN